MIHWFWPIAVTFLLTAAIAWLALYRMRILMRHQAGRERRCDKAVRASQEMRSVLRDQLKQAAAHRG